MKPMLWMAALPLLMLPAACDEGEDRPASMAIEVSEEDSMPLRTASLATVATVATADMDGGEVRAAVPAGRHIIREIAIDLEVEEVAEARRVITALVERSGGFVSHLHFGRAGENGHAQLTLRIPADRVGSIGVELGEIGRVLNERHGSQDITQQYLDTETRLRVLRETDARLRTILASRTGKLADVLQVERELARVITDIERLEGQRRYWDEQVDLATVQVSLSEPVPVIQAGWTAPVIEAFRSSLGVLARSAGAAITLVAGALPFALLALVGWALWRGFRRVPSVSHRPAS